MGGCQNYGPFFGTLNIRCRIIIGTQKVTIILTTPHMGGGFQTDGGPQRTKTSGDHFRAIGSQVKILFLLAQV